MPLKPETIEAMDKAEAYAVRVINENAKEDVKLEVWRTMEIDEAMDILADICECKCKHAYMQAVKEGLHVTMHGHEHAIPARSSTGHYGR